MQGLYIYIYVHESALRILFYTHKPKILSLPKTDSWYGKVVTALTVF